MHLLYRPIRPADFEDCWRIVQGDRFYPPALKPSRTKFWHGLLAANSALSVLVEDTDRPACDRTRAFSFSVFVTNEFAAAAKTSLPPRIDAHLHAQAAAGGVSSVLGAAAVGHANARDGLILYAGPLGYASASTESEHVAVAEMMFSALFIEHAGYQIKELLLESALLTKWVASNAVGLPCRTDYAGYFRSHPDLLPPPEERPCLYGLTRLEALDTLGSRFLPLFLSARPRLGFRPSEQRLLSQCLQGGTNEEAAEALFISLSAVKKRWESIYARVASAAPELLASASGPEKRGLEKKDHLLAYLRRHPEELRPYRL